MRRQWRAIRPDNPERFIANVFHAVLFAEGRVKGRLGADFPFSLALDHNLGTPADEEQNLFRFFVDVVGIMLPTSVMFIPMETLLTPPNLGASRSLETRGGVRYSP